MKNAFLEGREFERIDLKHNKQHFYSTLNFLNTHSGLRPGEVHFLLGPSGCGKSTLARKIALDSAKTKRVYYHLSEENIDDYRYKFNKQEREISQLHNIILTSELEIDEHVTDSHSDFFSWYFACAERTKANVLIIDNLSTSYLWSSGRPSDQEKVVIRLKKYAAEKKKPIMVVVHTKKEITNGNPIYLNPEDVRGNARTAMMASYWYSMQFVRHPQYGLLYFIRINKARFHDNCLWRSFKLRYDTVKGGITEDIEISGLDLDLIMKEAKDLKNGKAEYTFKKDNRGNNGVQSDGANG